MLLLNPLPQRLDTGATPTFAGLLAGDGTAAAPSIAFANSTNMGFFRYGTNDLGVSVLGATSFIIGSGGTLYGANGTARLTLPASGSVGLVAAGTNQSITLTPSGTGRVQCGATTDGATATPLIISAGGTYMNAGTFSASLKIRSYDGAGGIAGIGADTTGMVVGTSYAAPICFYTNGVEAVRIFENRRVSIGNTTTDSGALLQIGTNTTTSAGGMVFGTDCFLYRQGAEFMALDTPTSPSLLFRTAGTTRMLLQGTASRGSLSSVGSIALVLQTNLTDALTLDASQNALFVGNVITATSSQFGWTSRSRLSCPADGIITLFNTANTDFTRLQFGGTTASFPALRRTGAQLDAVVADNSGWANFAASSLIANSVAATVSAGQIAFGGTTATTVGAAGGASALPATPTGYIIVNVAGTQMKVPYYAN